MCFIFDAGNFFSCVCNINHPACTNNSCMTDIECARHIEKDLTNNVLIRDDQFCILHVPDAATCGTPLRQNKTYISYLYCCRSRDTDNCNSNDTAIDEVIRINTDSACLHIYVFICVCVFTCIMDVFVCMCPRIICVYVYVYVYAVYKHICVFVCLCMLCICGNASVH